MTSHHDPILFQAEEAVVMATHNGEVIGVGVAVKHDARQHVFLFRELTCALAIGPHGLSQFGKQKNIITLGAGFHPVETLDSHSLILEEKPINLQIVLDIPLMAAILRGMEGKRLRYKDLVG